jgi:membrane protein implicated in regulation of membrane protease activity
MDILWWHWLVLGLVLVVGELATPGGFYLLFFGLGAIIVGLLAGIGLAGPLTVQVLGFTVLSVALLALFRARLLRWMQGNPQAPAIDSLVGEIATTIEPLEPHAVGKVELRGTSWSARNASDSAIAAGRRCKVSRVEGLMLYVRPEGGHS